MGLGSSYFDGDNSGAGIDGGEAFLGDGLYDDFDSGAEIAKIDEMEAARAEAERLLGEAQTKCDEIIAAANSRARTIIDAAKFDADAHYNMINEQANAEAEALREQARSEGESIGRDEGRAAYESLLTETERIRDEAEAEYAKLLAGAESDALELVLGIAKKVIGDEIAYNRDNLISMIKDAFLHCTNKEEVILKVSSVDYEFVLANKDQLLSAVEGVDKIEIKRDLALGQGACFIETPFGNLDAGASTRISKIEDAFYHILSANKQFDR